MKLAQYMERAKARGVSQAEMARRLGVTRSYFCRLQNDEDKVCSLSVAFGIELVTGGQVTMQDMVPEDEKLRWEKLVDGPDSDSGLRGADTQTLQKAAAE